MVTIRDNKAGQVGYNCWHVGLQTSLEGGNNRNGKNFAKWGLVHNATDRNFRSLDNQPRDKRFKKEGGFCDQLPVGHQTLRNDRNRNISVNVIPDLVW